jgi:hypothetical protein
VSRKTRFAFVFLAVEAGLACLWWYLARYGAANPGSVTSDFQATVGQTMGMTMGALLGVGVILFFVAAARDRKERS